MIVLRLWLRVPAELLRLMSPQRTPMPDGVVSDAMRESFTASI